MRFKQFLIEYTSEVQSAEVLELISNIKRDCSPYLQELSSIDLSTHGLYRGEERSPVPFYKSAPFKDRQPVDNSQYVHKKADDWFHNKFNIRTQSSALFVVPSVKFAKRYGVPYIIFPIGAYRYVWSPDVEDLVHYINPKSPIEPQLDKAGYTDTHLATAVEHKLPNEVMLECGSYYAIRLTLWDDITRMHGDDILRK